jgi:hypothetical protein
MTLIPIGKTTVKLDMIRWDGGFEIRILCTDYPYSDYDAIRSKQSTAELNEVIDWIIVNEDQANMKGYTKEQVEILKDEIHSLITSH